MKIADSGHRREFETGAVRDMAEGKGRFDLVPLDIMAQVCGAMHCDSWKDEVIDDIARFTENKNPVDLYNALNWFINNAYGKDVWTAMLDVAKHFEEGAKKYGENNWKKGLPINCYIDSAVRHYVKYMRGDQDEPHGRAFMWNIMCALWTLENLPTGKRCVEATCFYNCNLICTHDKAEPTNCKFFEED